MADLRAGLHEEIDRMATEDLAAPKGILSTYSDRLCAAMRGLPHDDEPVTEAEIEALDEAVEWLEQNGGRGIPHDDGGVSSASTDSTCITVTMARRRTWICISPRLLKIKLWWCGAIPFTELARTLWKHPILGL